MPPTTAPVAASPTARGPAPVREALPAADRADRRAEHDRLHQPLYEIADMHGPRDLIGDGDEGKARTPS